jgi:UDP-3-O-[3-hydroxymyristoyl] glucosamine N-acyltransferase
MTLPQPVPVRWLAEFTGAALHGIEDANATGLNEIHKVQSGDVSFVDHPKYYDRCLKSPASVIIINQEVPVPEGKTVLVHPDPFAAYVSLVKHFRPFEPAREMISSTALIGVGTHLQPGAFVGHRVRIGEHCLIHANAVIGDDTIIGDRVIIGPGTTLGSDAFYYKRRTERAAQWDKLESCGRVVVEDDVEIGAGCTIDRGVSGDTIIGAGTKMDNAVHIGHGVVIGKNCLLAAQVGIAGKTVLEDEVILWGQVGVNKSLTIGKGAVVYAQSGVPASIEGGKVYFGSPVGEAKAKMRELGFLKRLPEMWARLRSVKEEE